MSGVLEDGSAETQAPVAKVKKPRAPRPSRAKKVVPAQSAPVPPSANTEDVLPLANTEGVLPLDMPTLVREATSSRGRGRPIQDKWATIEARVRGGEFASKDSKSDLAIFVSRTLKADPGFKPAMGTLMRSLGYEDMVSVFGL